MPKQHVSRSSLTVSSCTWPIERELLSWQVRCAVPPSAFQVEPFHPFDLKPRRSDPFPFWLASGTQTLYLGYPKIKKRLDHTKRYVYTKRSVLEVAMKRLPAFVRAEIRVAKRKWSGLGGDRLAELQSLVRRYHLSVSLGDVVYIERGWYVTHSGLLRLAHRRNCAGISTYVERKCSDPSVRRWVFKAVVHGSLRSKDFVGYGDADPPNVSSLSTGPRCASPKPVPSTARCEKPTASDCARWKNSDHPRVPADKVRPSFKQLRLEITPQTVSRASAIVSACSSDSTSLTPTRQSLRRRLLRYCHSARPPAILSKPSSMISP